MKKRLTSVCSAVVTGLTLAAANAFAAVDMTGVTYSLTDVEAGAAKVIGFVLGVSCIIALIGLFRRGRN